MSRGHDRLRDSAGAFEERHSEARGRGLLAAGSAIVIRGSMRYGSIRFPGAVAVQPVRVALVGVALGVFAAACGDSAAERGWGGAQTCSVVLPPIAVSEPVAPVLLPVAPDIAASANGFSLRNFTLGPLAGFSCVARQLEVTFAEGPGGRPIAPEDGARPVVLEPFECQAPDGRIYEFEGTGAADVRGMYFTSTFSAWLDGGQGTVVCTTTLRRQTGSGLSLDAGVLELGVDAAPL